MICAVCLVEIRKAMEHDTNSHVWSHYDMNGYGGDVGNDWWPLEWRHQWWEKHPEDDLIYPGHAHSPEPKGETCHFPVRKERIK